MPLTISLVAADGELWVGEASQIVAKTVEGEIGILTGHEPILAVLAAGEVRITDTAGQVVTARAEDGFLSVQNDTVTVVAARAELV